LTTTVCMRAYERERVCYLLFSSRVHMLTMGVCICMFVCVYVVCVLPAVLIEGEHLDDERTSHCQRAAQIVPIISR
jgi:hypothetical protein